MGWDGRTDLVCDCSLVKTILMYRRDVFVHWEFDAMRCDALTRVSRKYSRPMRFLSSVKLLLVVLVTATQTQVSKCPGIS
jgi:hypothetical protein